MKRLGQIDKKTVVCLLLLDEVVSRKQLLSALWLG
ncbi:hypothetical protein Rifp1Sym_fn00060 [endosymbiont of Riftia pachyptila (vent Ph05)]|uniref:Uncharacterized protein n=1 Tax=endosymbiont of Riftia pachyptila (vent Ph05) TaxID=1048808 RepID=G2DHP7_9GAMM|nr:hypothetical protein Rifp1Sym_fn00060 [endosymbiont of Riftia pachyptila (vent Ph05)]